MYEVFNMYFKNVEMSHAMNTTVQWNNSQIFELLKKSQIPQKYIAAIYLIFLITNAAIPK